jgi:hypothetical protein
MAFTVRLWVRVKGPVYGVDEVVGVLPSVV